jgi:hypothetical protein
MTSLQSYIIQYQNKPIYELNHIKKALTSLGGFFNTEEDNIRLKAVTFILNNKKD